MGCKDKTIKLIDLKNKNLVKNLRGHNTVVISIKKIMHPQYGQCLLSQGYENEKIKIWVNNLKI